MKDLFKKSLLTGLGFAVVSKEKLEETVKEMIDKGNLTEKEGEKLVEEMVGYADKTKGEMEKQIDKYVEKAINRLGLARKSDLQELQSSIMLIQQQLEKDGQN